MTALVVTGDVEGKLQRLQWRPGQSPYGPFRFRLETTDAAQHSMIRHHLLHQLYSLPGYRHFANDAWTEQTNHFHISDAFNLIIRERISFRSHMIETSQTKAKIYFEFQRFKSDNVKYCVCDIYYSGMFVFDIGVDGRSNIEGNVFHHLKYPTMFCINVSAQHP